MPTPDMSQVPAAESPRSHTFTRYVRLVLPLDGFVFWVRADLAGPAPLSTLVVGASPPVEARAATMQVQGSLHYESTTEQTEEETYAVNRVVFTATNPVDDLNTVAPGEMWMTEVSSAVPGGGLDRPQGRRLRFAFGRRDWFFEQAGIHHYVGTAVYPDMETQVIDDPAQINVAAQVVSNSLPLWLAMNNYTSILGLRVPCPLFPSFLTPENQRPPWAAVHISGTEAISSAPYLAPDGSHDQFCSDMVRITTYGVRNEGAMDLVDVMNEYSLGDGRFGIMSMPVVRDEKRTQSDLATIAMRKVLEVQVSYHQSQARAVARQLIQEAIPSYVLEN